MNLNVHLAASGSSRSAAETRYMSDGRDCGSLISVFSWDVARFEVGSVQPADDARACHAWWPVTLDGCPIGELRDDAAGFTFHDNFRI